MYYFNEGKGMLLRNNSLSPHFYTTPSMICSVTYLELLYAATF